MNLAGFGNQKEVTIIVPYDLEGEAHCVVCGTKITVAMMYYYGSLLPEGGCSACGHEFEIKHRRRSSVGKRK
jgi:hypothetical protein